VRDEIALLPTTASDMHGAGTAIRWGARATLRGAAGTPRERAEVLKDLYLRAGFPAQVVTGQPKAGATVSALLAKAPVRQFRAAGMTAADHARWRQILKIPADSPAPAALDPKGELRASIARTVRATLGPLPTRTATFDPTLSEVPLVKVTVAGNETYANPNLDGLAFGDSGTVDTPAPAALAEGERSVRVSVEAVTTLGARHALVEGVFRASDVAGRTLTAAFATPDSRAEATRKQVGQADTFIPMLLVAGPGLDTPSSFQLSTVGKPFTSTGDLLDLAPDGSVSIEGERAAPPPSDPARLAQVVSLDVVARALAFPRVELWVSAKDARGVPVPGLAADAFRVREQGTMVGGYLRRSQAVPPRVLMLFDRSTSIPPEFLDGAPAVGHAIAQAVFTAFPGSQVAVAGVDINGPAFAGTLTSDLGQVDANLANLSGTGSSLWENLAIAAAQANATTVVLVSDMVPDDEATAEALAHIAGGAPVLVAGVGTVDAATAQRIAEVSGGKVLANITPAGLAAQVTAYLAEQARYDYRIVYHAPEGAPATRTLVVSVASPLAPAGTATYTVPSIPLVPDGIKVLYLTVASDGHQVVRQLAGSEAGTAADREEVRGALFGKYVLGVEANPPSLSILLDEHVHERLALEKGMRAYRAGDVATMETEAQRAFPRVPAELRFFASPYLDEGLPGDMTFVDGLTVTLYSTRPVLEKKLVRKLDMLPLAPRRTVVFAGGDGYGLTLDRTSRLAAHETTRFPKSTFAQLQGVPLAVFDPLTIDLELGSPWQGVTDNYLGYDILAPVAGKPVAFFAVHRETGEVIGGLSDGGGSGEGEDLDTLVNRLDTLLETAERAGTALGFEGISVWTTLESIKLHAVANAIALFEGRPSVDGPNILENEACEAGANEIIDHLPGISDLNDVLGDLGFILDWLSLLSGREGPPLPDPAAAACEAMLGT
jgi:hypothetical protein